MNFKDKIKYHRHNRLNLSEELLEIALSDAFPVEMKMEVISRPFKDEVEGDIIIKLPRWRPNYAEGTTFEEKLARNLRVMIVRHVRIANSIREKKLFEGTQLEMMQGEDPLHHIYSAMTSRGYQYYKDDFDKVPKKFWKELEESSGQNYSTKIKSEFKEFLNILPAINRHKEELLEVYKPLLIDALNETLGKVDLNRSDMDIVAYVANGVRWRVQRSLTRVLGTKVHQIDGKKYYVTKKKIRSEGFKRTKSNDILKIDQGKLSSRQYVFFDKLIRCIQKEIDSINIEVFTFDEDGKPIEINKRYFAQMMEMPESNFKHRLRRMYK